MDDLAPDEYETVFRAADAMQEILTRDIPRVPTLRGKTLATLFYEASTRTRVSFEIAAKALGADVVNLTASSSSVSKGESLIDTVRTLEALGADAVVIRHPQAGAPYLAARNLGCTVINAGDGWHAHPTQALLDLYTVQQHRGGITGLKVVIVGDILHSRVARSNLWGFSALGARIILCGPPTLLPRSVSQHEGWGLPPAEIEPSLEAALEGADVVMALRVQTERQQTAYMGNLRDYIRLYQITSSRLRLAKPDVLLMHPGPTNEGVELTAEVAQSAQAVI
ncbi:MAG: aspartate carbamoyltransferase catalytic subunit, partial [Thermomicrobiales bacterium]